MTITRAKFKCNSITLTQSSRAKTNDSGEPIVDESNRPVYEVWNQPSVTLNPVYHHNDPTHENSKFWAASPSGELKMSISNPGGAEVFEIGREYYVDFTPVPVNDAS